MKNNPFIPAFQRRLLAILLQRPDTYNRYQGIWDPTYFDDPLHRKIVHAYIHIRVIGGEQPDQLSVRQQLLKDYDLSGDLPVDVTKLIAEMEAVYSISTDNINYSLDEVRQCAQRHALVHAIETSVGYINSGTPEKIRELIDKAISVGNDVRFSRRGFLPHRPSVTR